MYSAIRKAALGTELNLALNEDAAKPDSTDSLIVGGNLAC